jgi:hypothetical protein
MLGVMLTDKEGIELEYIIKREMDEIRNDKMLETHHPIVQRAIEERYKLLLKLLIRIAPKSDCIRYLSNPIKVENKFNKKC